MIIERYYIFRHIDGLDTSYLGHDDEWVDRLEDAVTFDSEEVAEWSFGWVNTDIQYTHVIGKLEVNCSLDYKTLPGRIV